MNILYGHKLRDKVFVSGEDLAGYNPSPLKGIDMTQHRSFLATASPATSALVATVETSLSALHRLRASPPH